MYRVRLKDFEGPLDLLLFFIRRDEIDIFDIPIARIADEFLEHVRCLETVDLDGAADFIFMAALLIELKVKMLLPRPVIDEEGDQVDPRQDLVDRLVEYMRFKEVAKSLAARQDERAKLFTRGEAYELPVEDDDESYVNTTLSDLVMALGRVLSEEAEAPSLIVETPRVTVEEQRVFIRDALERHRRVAFADLVRDNSKTFIITTFLAVLEMAQLSEVWLTLMPESDDFFVQRLPLGADSISLN